MPKETLINLNGQPIAPAPAPVPAPKAPEAPKALEAPAAAPVAAAPAKPAAPPKPAGPSKEALELQALRAEIEVLKAPKPAAGPTLEQRLKQDPLKTLAELGVTQESLTNAMLEQPNPEVSAMKDEIASLKGMIEQLTNGAKTAQQQQYEQAKQAIRHDVANTIKGKPEYETMSAYGDYALDAAVSFVETVFQKEGVLLTPEEAAQAIEEHLLEEAIKIASVGKVKAKLVPAPAPEAPAPTESVATPAAPSTPHQQRNTLTNTMQARTSVSNSEQARRARAIAAFQGKTA